MGTVNGMRPNGRVDTGGVQSQEVWPGVTYSLAATMLQVGMDKEAFDTAKGAVDTTYDELGGWFTTPEVWNAVGNNRSPAYVRPLAFWAMQRMWERER